jgi:CubicO group peptidase (beta-lactamase class C family)
MSCSSVSRLLTTVVAALVGTTTSTLLYAQPAPPYGESPDRPDPARQVIADPALADFDKFVEAQLKRWNTPGVAITVVKDGKVILQKGYGQRDVAKKLPMTAQTVQPIASVTKSFTVASLGTLVRDGKLSWDKPVREFMPDFKMFNDYATLNATPRDLVTHRTGLPRHDASWYNSTATREELYKRIQHLEPSAQLRETWQYNNFMFMTAGYMGGRIAGASWEQLVSKSLLEPIGMRSTSFTIDAMMKTPNVGLGYKWDKDEKPQPLEYTPLSAMGPTGSMNSNVEDMARYLRMYLGRGEFEGKRILNVADIVDMTNPQMVMSDARVFDEISSTQYGMGFFLTHYRGERLVHHGGNMPGASSLLSFMPQRGIGVFMTANLSNSPLPSILTYAIYDRLLELKPVDWSGRRWERKEKNKASEESAKKQKLSPRKKGTKPAHPLEDYAGSYEHPGYGVMSFSILNGNLVGTYNRLTSPFNHFHFEVFEAPEDKLNDLSDMKVTFITDINGEVSAFQSQLEDGVKPIEFKRQPDKSFKDPAFLKAFSGEYELGPTKVTVALRPDGVLTLAIPGQPVYEMIGTRGRKFALKNLEAYYVEFIPDKSGVITQAAFFQPDGNFVAIKK